MQNFSGWADDLRVEVGGHGIVSHTGSVAVRALADRSGLTGRLSAATTRRGFVPVHDRGRVLVDTAVMIADGGRVLSDLAVLRDQGELFGSVASDPPLWRTLNAVDALTRDKIAVARAKTRVHVWNLISERHGGIRRRRSPTPTWARRSRSVWTPPSSSPTPKKPGSWDIQGHLGPSPAHGMV